MDESCECNCAESETFYVNYQHFLDSLIANLCDASKISEKTIMWEVIIHFSFLISAIAMAYTDKILYSTSHKNHSG